VLTRAPDIIMLSIIAHGLLVLIYNLMIISLYYIFSVNFSCILLLYITRCSAIAERPRCRMRYSFRQK